MRDGSRGRQVNQADLDLADLRAFFLVAETGSFSRAARRLEQAKSAVSRRVARLESLLAVQLLQRTAAGAILTEAGQSYYDEAYAAVSQLHQAADNLGTVVGEVSGPIRITVPIYFGAIFLAPEFCEFMRLHPTVELEVHLSDEKLDLVRHGFDLAVRIGYLPDSTLVSRTLTTSRRFLVASPEYLESHAPITRPEDLSEHRILHYNSLNPQELWKYHLNGERRQIAITPYFRSNSATMLMTAVATGKGLTVMPNYITESYVRSGQAVQVLKDVDWDVSPVNLLLPAGRRISRRIRALVDFLVSRFNGREV